MGLGSLAYALTGSFGEVERPAVAAVPRANEVAVERRLKTVPIESIGLGKRVLAKLPTDAEALADTEIDPATWRRLALRLSDKDRVVDIELLRSIEWLVEGYDPESGTLWVDLSEMGIEGFADLVEITDCPEIEGGEGRLVTGRFRHLADRVISVEIAGEREPLGVTPNHPFWSVDRREFVPAGELRVGEQLERADGTVTTVASLASRGERIVVYNLEVDAEHVYRVGDGGLLVHNQYVKNGHHPIPKFLGGNAVQPLTSLGRRQHKEFHRMLHDNLQKRFPDLSGLGGPNGSRSKWIEEFNTNGTQQAAFRILTRTARQFDKMHGTNTLSQVQANIKSGLFEAR